MKQPKVGLKSESLLVFADIVDSSKYSSVLGFSEYAKKLIEFQQLFSSLGRRYFPEPDDKTKNYCDVSSRGDEGTIFVLEPKERERANLIFKTIKFLYHIKGSLYFRSDDIKKDTGPLYMGIGAGIHVGPVVYSTDLINNHSEIVQIDGFSINKAKRVESASRLGRLTRIMLSKEAARLLEGEPIILSPLTASMKGIEEHAELYEVQSGLFRRLDLKINDKRDAHLIDKAIYLAEHPEDIYEPWLKSLVISILDFLIENTVASEHKDRYRKLQLKLAWGSTLEDDPILLYLRAKEYQEEKKYTQQIRYLRKILKKHPDFIFAKKQLVKACWEITKRDEERAEKIFARDVAHEFLTKFSAFLSSDEIIIFKKIVKQTNKKK